MSDRFTLLSGVDTIVDNYPDGSQRQVWFQDGQLQVKWTFPPLGGPPTGTPSPQGGTSTQTAPGGTNSPNPPSLPGT